MPPYEKIEQRGPVTSVWFDVPSDWRQDFLLRTDAHHDSIQCNRELETRHLDEAKRRNALIIDGGDLFDAMQGKYDPRRSLDELRSEFRTDKYYDAIEDDAAKFYAPYAPLFLVMGHGNHESAVLKSANLDLTSRLIGRLNREHNGHIQAGGFGGWIVFYFKLRGSTRTSLRMYYHHGAGTAAPVTKGVIDTARQAVYLPDADVVLNGHNHQEYTLSIKRSRISTKGTLYNDLLWFARTPGYKDEYSGLNGWAVEKGMAPHPLGAVWMHLEAGHDRVRITMTADVE